MKIARKYPLLGSSVDPDKISLTLKASVPLLVFLVGAFNLNVMEGEIDAAVQGLCAVISGGFVVYGLVRKMLN